MKNILMSLLIKLALWLFPELITAVSNYLETGLIEVENVDGVQMTGDEKRGAVLLALRAQYSFLPDLVHFAAIEFCLIVYRLGVTATLLNELETMFRSMLNTGANVTREMIMEIVTEKFPELPEKAGRLVVEWVLSRLGIGGW